MENKELKEYCEKQILEIQKHKWIESEKAGRDLGEDAVFDWVTNYAVSFRVWWNTKINSQDQ